MGDRSGGTFKGSLRFFGLGDGSRSSRDFFAGFALLISGGFFLGLARIVLRSSDFGSRPSILSGDSNGGTLEL